MDWFSSDSNRPGVFAVSQEATGIFALGQGAIGVVAIGQLALGVVAIGQGAVGFIAVGQGAIGVLYCVAMMGVGARGFGGVLPVFPARRKESGPPKPDETSLDVLRAMGDGNGFVKVTLVRDGSDVRVEHGGMPLGVVADSPAAKAIPGAFDDRDRREAYVRVVASRTVDADGPGYRDAPAMQTQLGVTELHGWTPPETSLLRSRGITSASLVWRALAMCVLLGAWWFIAGQQIVAMFR